MILFEMLQNRWVQRALELVLIVAACLLIRAHFIEQGKRAGRADMAVQSAGEIEKQRALDRISAVQAVDAADKLRAEAQARYDGALARESVHIAELRNLQHAQSIAQDQVKALPASELHGFITQKLGRPATDSSPGYSGDEERRIAGCLASEPLCQEKADALGAQVTELAAQVKALADQVRAGDDREQALASYTHQLEQDYTLVYNSLPRRRNWLLSIATLGIRGKPRPIAAPDPRDLHHP